MIALRSCDTKYIPVPSRQERPRGRRKGGRNWEMFKRSELGHTYVPDRAYRIPSDFDKWAAEKGDTAQHFLTEIFKETVMHTERAQYSMARVMATKDGRTATFSVNIHRSSYFFQDRDYTTTESGTRKRIFHFVRPHVRADGTEVKAHFRGEREFHWAGYDIKITIPGRDHILVDDIDVGATDEYWWEKDVEYIELPELGKKVRKWIDGSNKW